MKTGVVDDSGFMRLVLKKIISENTDLEFIWDASDGLEALEKNNSNPADIIISDMEMPKMDGLGLLKNLKENNVNAECIIISGQHESGAPKILEAIRLGAIGFVSKNDDTGQSNLDTMGKALDDLTKSIVKKVKFEKINRNIQKVKLEDDFEPSKVLVIAGSAGSLDPLSDVFNGLGEPKVPVITAIHIPKKIHHKRTCSWVVGKLVENELLKPCRRLKKIENFTVHLYGLSSPYWGQEQIVTGLLTGQDLIKGLKGKNLGHELLLPSVMLKQGEKVFLDDMTLQELCSSLNVSVRIVYDAQDIVNRALGKA